MIVDCNVVALIHQPANNAQYDPVGGCLGKIILSRESYLQQSIDQPFQQNLRILFIVYNN